MQAERKRKKKITTAFLARVTVKLLSTLGEKTDSEHFEFEMSECQENAWSLGEECGVKTQITGTPT